MTVPLPRSRAGKVVSGIVVLVLAAGVVAFLARGRGAAPEPPDVGPTRYGAAFQTDPGEGYDGGLARVDRTLGRLAVVRVFYQGAPEQWPGKVPGRDVVVSFKLSPRQVLSGRYDEQMRSWFAAAPRDHDVWWVYWHEPEDNIESGAFTAQQYRDAFAHLDELADQAGNPKLHSTVVLQSFSTRKQSGRSWKDYVPDAAHVDVLAWDVYNREAVRGKYSSPGSLLDDAVHASATLGRAFAIAEVGSAVARGDDGTGRAEWLRALSAYVERHHAAFVCYFDFDRRRDDYRLEDEPSINAWRAISGG